jgi:hypothetical protein
MYIFDGDVKCVVFVHLVDCPRSLLAVPTKETTLVAGFAQSNAGVVVSLLDVVRITWG